MCGWVHLGGGGRNFFCDLLRGSEINNPWTWESYVLGIWGQNSVFIKRNVSASQTPLTHTFSCSIPSAL